MKQDTISVAQRALAVIEEFRKLDHEMTSVRMAALLFIYLNPECSMRELREFLGVTQGSGLKILKYYEDMGLVTHHEVADPYPRKALTVTDKGNRIIRSLENYINII